MACIATAMMIDTLQLSRRLRDAGADERVADAVAPVVAEAARGSREDLASKGGSAALRAEVTITCTELEKAIIASQNRMLLALGAMLATTVGVLFTLLRH